MCELPGVIPGAAPFRYQVRFASGAVDSTDWVCSRRWISIERARGRRYVGSVLSAPSGEIHATSANRKRWPSVSLRVRFPVSFVTPELVASGVVMKREFERTVVVSSLAIRLLERILTMAPSRDSKRQAYGDLASRIPGGARGRLISRSQPLAGRIVDRYPASVRDAGCVPRRKRRGLIEAWSPRLFNLSRIWCSTAETSWPH